MQFARPAVVVGALFLGILSAADSDDRRRGHAMPLSQAPVLDGKVMEDPAWAGLAPFTGFTQLRPDSGAPASERTEVYFGFTDDTLHVGVICHVPDPATITVSNDGFQSDSFTMVLDTFGTGRAGVAFGTNPVGAEYDGQVAGEFVDWNWSTLWEVRARTHGTGWSAEFAIPFQSLRYGRGDVQHWRVNFARVIRHASEVSYWSPVPRQFSMYRLSLAGQVDGIRVPRRRHNLEVTPYVVGSAARGGDRSGVQRRDDAGFDVKYSITPSLTLDLTYNTDFAQVESDKQQVNLGRFSLFFPETRPFFLENAGSFGVGFPGTRLFHSRRIGIAKDGRRLPIDGGVRVSGKVGAATNLGFLHMRAQAADGRARDDFTVTRASRDLPNRSAVGFIATDRRDGSSSRQTYGIDGSLGIGANGQMYALVGRTRTPGVGSDDHLVNLYASYNSTDWDVDGAYTEIGSGFDPAVGFVTRTGSRRVGAFAMRKFVDEDTLREWRPFVSYAGFWDFDGYHESGDLHLESWWIWKSGADVWPALNFIHEGVKRPFAIAGVTVPAGEYQTRTFQLGAASPQNATWSVGTHLVTGGFYNGQRHAVFPIVNYRRDETLSAWAGWDYNRIDLESEDGSFSVNLARAGFSYSFSPKINLAALVQYNDADEEFSANVRFSWLRSANAGLYLVYNELDARSGLGPPQRELVLKYSRIFDVL
ncbi:MAG: DUF5916 domain-containing protein [Gammaproteobacteria bacterium]|nr:DUF5916 domain-containing protein [Gammaproteobacteria bacterium]